jgi:hypothetical protein
VRLLIILVSQLLLAACSHQIVLPGPSAELAVCAVKITDSRPEPDAMYAHMQGGVLRIELVPPLAKSLNGRICTSIEATKRQAGEFVITDVSCVVTGFVDIRYVAEIRGKLIAARRTAEDIRVSNIFVSSLVGYVPKGCETAIVPLLDQLSHTVLKSLSSASSD